MKIRIWKWMVEVTKAPKDPFNLSTHKEKVLTSRIDQSILVRNRKITKFNRITHARTYFRENGRPEFKLSDARDWVEKAYPNGGVVDEICT